MGAGNRVCIWGEILQEVSRKGFWWKGKRFLFVWAILGLGAKGVVMSDRPAVDKMLQHDGAEVKIGCRIVGYCTCLYYLAQVQVQVCSVGSSHSLNKIINLIK